MERSADHGADSKMLPKSHARLWAPGFPISSLIWGDFTPLRGPSLGLEESKGQIAVCSRSCPVCFNDQLVAAEGVDADHPPCLRYSNGAVTHYLLTWGESLNLSLHLQNRKKNSFVVMTV